MPARIIVFHKEANEVGQRIDGMLSRRVTGRDSQMQEVIDGYLPQRVMLVFKGVAHCVPIFVGW
jgi:hypothetical protein